MLQIKNFRLTDNLTRRTYDFSDDKLVRTTKSLTLDTIDEIEYKNIQRIKSGKTVSLEWVQRTLYLCIIAAVINMLLEWMQIDITFAVEIEKLLIFASLVAIIVGTRAKEYWSFLDKDRYYLATVWVGKKDHEKILRAVQLIKQKVKLVSELHADTPSPDELPKFEIVQYNIPSFFDKSIMTFYEDKYIDFEISILHQRIFEVNYHELNGKVKTIKYGNRYWGEYLLFWLSVPLSVFIIGDIFFQYVSSLFVFLLAIGLPILLSFLRYAKEEFVIFYTNNDDPLFEIKRTKRNREKVDQIIEFIQKKTLSE